MFASGLQQADIEQALGDAFAGAIPNNYRLVREAIDRGVPLDEVKPGNKITAQLKKLMLPQDAAKPTAKPRRRSGRASSASRWRGKPDDRPFHRPPQHRARARSRRSRRAPLAPAPMSWIAARAGGAAGQAAGRSRPIRCSPTSCSTPRCACTAG